MFPNKTDEQSFLDLYGDVSDLDNATLARLQSLEYSVLDVDNVKLYMKLARRCHERAQPLVAPEPSNGRRSKVWNAFDRYDGHIMKTFLALMQQSIYNTRLSLQSTNTIRARYRSDVSYNIGQLYGSLMELKFKLARVLNTMQRINDERNNKLTWYLLLYERALQIHTDSTTTVQRIFLLNRGGFKSLTNENEAAEEHSAKQRHQKMLGTGH